jgi:hypothetical protein
LIRKPLIRVSRSKADAELSRAGESALQHDFGQLCDHPNIAEPSKPGGKTHYGSERLDGESLRDVLKHLSPERLSVAEADDIVRAVGSALVYAHDHGVVHGDVCTANVLVTMGGRFMLTNFFGRPKTRVGRRGRRPSDDLVALATLAAELYAGGSSRHALRAAGHSGVPATRVNAIRAVLEAPFDRHAGGIAEFLADSELSSAGVVGASALHTARQEPAGWLWRYGLPVAVLITIGFASHYLVGEWRKSISTDDLAAARTAVGRGESSGPPGVMAADVTMSDGRMKLGLDGALTRSAAVPAWPETIMDTTVEPQPAKATVTAASPSAVARSGAAPTDLTVVSMSISRIAVREDHAVVGIEIIRSGDTTSETSVRWRVTPETANPDEDYRAAGTQVLSFPSGSTAQRLSIPIIDDSIRESDEAFTVHLSAPRNGVAGDLTSTRVTVYDDD